MKIIEVFGIGKNINNNRKLRMIPNNDNSY